MSRRLFAAAAVAAAALSLGAHWEALEAAHTECPQPREPLAFTVGAVERPAEVRSTEARARALAAPEAFLRLPPDELIEALIDSTRVESIPRNGRGLTRKRESTLDHSLRILSVASVDPSSTATTSKSSKHWEDRLRRHSSIVASALRHGSRTLSAGRLIDSPNRGTRTPNARFVAWARSHHD